MKNLAVGIDIGGTNTVIGIVDRAGKVYYKTSVPTQTHEKVEDYILELHQEIEKGKTSINSDVNIVGIGIGAPNGNYFKGTIEHAANLRWNGIVEFTSLLSKHYDIPLFLTNDANAAAIGEMIYGGAKGMKDFVVITLGTGLGSGIVVNGKLLYGHNGFAGELGHVIVEKGGRNCNCGRKGCLETYVSATGLVRTTYELLAHNTEESILRSIPYNKMTSKKVYDAAIGKDILASEAFRLTAKTLGEAIADYTSITCPEAVFLFGGLANSKSILFDQTKQYMEENMLTINSNLVNLLPSQLGDEAAIMGSSALVWSELE